MATKFQPRLGDYFRFVTQGTWQPRGTDYEINFGDIETSGATPNLTDIERYSREFAEKTLARSDTIQKDMTLSLTVMSLMREVAQMMWMDADGDLLTQAAVTAQTKTFSNLKVGRIYDLGHVNTSINSADDDGSVPVVFVEDVHYKHNSELGKVELIAIPASATKLVMEFDAAEIDAEDDIAVYGGMAGQGVFGTLRYYGVSDIGQNFKIEFWNVRIKPSGEISLQGGDDYGQVQLDVRVYADGTKPDKFRFFKVTELKN
ncbi:hypothetical protein ELI15_14180 [Rhizobium ruizarguesonis]|uniref:phage tail tube protein n=1 Tax=Rhizobium ruizarguesonis TaxID=2081791 RepID=UPI00102F5528|nr:hypothetical protein [Rhizobium ruizarguesonis]TAW65438.1 hypothetical protein ELI15_14180 [Rhizobium ruizarguesonis]